MRTSIAVAVGGLLAGAQSGVWANAPELGGSIHQAIEAAHAAPSPAVPVAAAVPARPGLKIEVRESASRGGITTPYRVGKKTTTVQSDGGPEKVRWEPFRKFRNKVLVHGEYFASVEGLPIGGRAHGTGYLEGVAVAHLGRDFDSPFDLDAPGQTVYGNTGGADVSGIIDIYQGNTSKCLGILRVKGHADVRFRKQVIGNGNPNEPYPHWFTVGGPLGAWEATFEEGAPCLNLVGSQYYFLQHKQEILAVKGVKSAGHGEGVWKRHAIIIQYDAAIGEEAVKASLIAQVPGFGDLLPQPGDPPAGFYNMPSVYFEAR
ncbi:MAG: hypothetical protein HY078_17565 [Elusimicrobia bacterium]|nr:hypothetical protein [Elusimicrobiota bacterium]